MQIDTAMCEGFTPSLTTHIAPGLELEIAPPRLLDGTGLSTTTGVIAPDGGAWHCALGPITLVCTIRRESDRWEVTLRLTNAGPDRELAVRYPVLHYRFPDGTPLREFDPLFGGVLEKHTLWIERWYPGNASLCASFVAAPRQAVGLAMRNDQQRRVRLYHLPAATTGHMSLELERVLIRRGETLDLPSAYIATGCHWGDVLRPYRDWLQATYRRPLPLCDWYWNGAFIENRYAHCVAPTAPASGPDGVWTFDNRHAPQTVDGLKAEMDKAFALFDQRGLKPLFYQFGWWQAMATHPGTFVFDTVIGDCLAHHALIAPLIEYAHRRGGRTFLYTNFIAAGDDSRLFSEHPEYFAREPGGRPVRNASYPMYMLCPGAPGIRDYWDAVLRHILLDLDADGIFLDQVGGGAPNAYCYDPAHAHAHPDAYGRDYLALLDFVARRAREIKPDCFIGGELTSDIRSLWCDQMQGVGYSRPKERSFASPAEAAAAPPSEHFAFMSFINPEIAHLPSAPDYVARGCPGQPDDALWSQYRSVFRAGLQPCLTEPIGATAYLFGPVNGEAILATQACDEVGEVTVTLPTRLFPVAGGTHLARTAGDSSVRVEAGKEPRFYLLKEAFAEPPASRSSALPLSAERDLFGRGELREPGNSRGSSRGSKE
jgi:hypothetical protein